jgi:hypothetical protein
MNTLPVQKLNAVSEKTRTSVSLAAFDDYRKEAEWLVECYEDLIRMDKGIYPHCPAERLKEARESLIDEDDDDYDERLVSVCAKLEAEFNPEDAYDDDAEITRARVSKHIALLVGSFPNANPTDPKTYSKMLVEEVVAASPRVPVLESACRKIRRTCKFLPTISELLDAIEEEQKFWRRYWQALDCCDSLAEVLRRKVSAETERREAEQKRRDEISAARVAPICVGDRVRHLRSTVSFLSDCLGTVEEIITNPSGDDRVRVYFDERGYYKPPIRYLERLAACEETEQEHARRRAKKQPITVGDRVRHKEGRSVGTVTKLEDGACCVRSDKTGREVWVGGGVVGLERLVAGDGGLEPAAPLMIEHKATVPMGPIASPDGALVDISEAVDAAREGSA